MKLDFIKALIFDMDGLLFDTEMIACNSITQALEEHNLAPADNFYAKLIGKPRDNAIKQLKKAFGQDLDAGKILSLSEKYFMADIDKNGLPQKPGVIELLTLIERLKLKKIVASSSPRQYVMHKLEISGLNKYFKVAVCGDEITHGKPAPDIFLKAAEVINIPAQQCLVLEDSFAGITAGHAASMTTIMVPDILQPDDTIRQKADFILGSLLDVCRLLDQ